MRYGICEWCGAKFIRESGPGRPRKYCRKACRISYLKEVAQPAYNRRVKLRNVGRWI